MLRDLRARHEVPRKEDDPKQDRAYGPPGGATTADRAARLLFQLPGVKINPGSASQES